MVPTDEPLVAHNQVYLRILFNDAVKKCLSAENVEYPSVVTHVADTLYGGIGSEGFFVYGSDGRRIDSPAEMIRLGDSMREDGDLDAECNIRARTGDHTLMMLGMFPNAREVVSTGPGIYRDCGRYSYSRANEIQRNVFGQRAEKYQVLADFFPNLVRALRNMFQGGELLRTDADLQTWVPAAESSPHKW